MNSKIIIAVSAGLISIAGAILFQVTKQADLTEQSVGIQQAADVQAQTEREAIRLQQQDNIRLQKTLSDLSRGK